MGYKYILKVVGTLKNTLVTSKDKETIKQKSGLIYWFGCGRLDCDEEYIGESARTFNKRFKEHLKAPSPICEYQSSAEHFMSLEIRSR